MATGTRLKEKKCQVHPSDMRLHIPVNGLYTYPDVMVVCGNKEFIDDKKDTLLNPGIVIEVLSPSTADYDRGTKFMLYRSIPTLQHYILIDSRSYHVEKYSKTKESSWVLTEFKDLAVNLVLENLPLEIPISEIYEGVDDIP
jgi:Uma2 family endonuclease